MAQHKWHKEIKAWADGIEIQSKHEDELKWWDEEDAVPEWDNIELEFRIKPKIKFEFTEIPFEMKDKIISVLKPQPKEPQYLYVWLDKDEDRIEFDHYPVGDVKEDEVYKYIGKIKLEETER